MNKIIIKSNGGFPPLKLTKELIEKNNKDQPNKERGFASTIQSNVNIAQLLTKPTINTFEIKKDNDILEIIE
jgi:hypothetical protein